MRRSKTREILILKGIQLINVYFIIAVCAIAEKSGTFEYVSLGENVTLTCEHTKGAENLRWRRDEYILTYGKQINTMISWYRKFTIDAQTDVRQYNLRITNVTADDFGLYICEMQIGKETTGQRITLNYKGKLQTF